MTTAFSIAFPFPACFATSACSETLGEIPNRAWVSSHQLSLSLAHGDPSHAELEGAR